MSHSFREIDGYFCINLDQKNDKNNSKKFHHFNVAKKVSLVFLGVPDNNLDQKN